MHKFFAPLAYVLHVDIECLSQVRGLHEENFINKFDELSFHKKSVLSIILISKKFFNTFKDLNFWGKYIQDVEY